MSNIEKPTSFSAGKYPLNRVCSGLFYFITDDNKRVELERVQNRNGKNRVKVEITGFITGRPFTNWTLDSVISKDEAKFVRGFVRDSK